ncbi:Transcription termination factor [Trichinella spiralis]|uniref:Transcription termination factor n=1 Tax=Trichinella spiralis TaxID=6334 RepID=A0ABR3KD49_TRISP
MTVKISFSGRSLVLLTIFISIIVRPMSTGDHREQSSKRHKSQFEPLSEDEIPFWHRRNSRLSRDELELLKEMNITLKVGAFSEKEDRRIRKNWKRFSRFYNVEYRDFFYIENSEIPDRRSFLKSTNFYAELARKLPWRSSYSVIQRARSILHPNYENHANYTKEQTEALGNFVQEYGRKWAVIGDELGRTPLSVGYRYKTMRRRKGRFSPEEHTAFIEAIKTYLKKSTESELLNVHINEIAWSQVREQMPGRTLSQLRNHWCSWILKQTDISEYREKIFECLRYCVHHIGVSEYSDVDWEFVGECVGTDPYLARHVYYLAVNQFCRGVKEVSEQCEAVLLGQKNRRRKRIKDNTE